MKAPQSGKFSCRSSVSQDCLPRNPWVGSRAAGLVPPRRLARRSTALHGKGRWVSPSPGDVLVATPSQYGRTGLGWRRSPRSARPVPRAVRLGHNTGPLSRPPLPGATCPSPKRAYPGRRGRTAAVYVRTFPISRRLIRPTSIHAPERSDTGSETTSGRRLGQLAEPRALGVQTAEQLRRPPTRRATATRDARSSEHPRAARHR